MAIDASFASHSLSCVLCKRESSSGEIPFGRHLLYTRPMSETLISSLISIHYIFFIVFLHYFIGFELKLVISDEEKLLNNMFGYDVKQSSPWRDNNRTLHRSIKYHLSVTSRERMSFICVWSTFVKNRFRSKKSRWLSIVNILMPWVSCIQRATSQKLVKYWELLFWKYLDN